MTGFNYPEGCAALVTGASEGIGFAIAETLALAGVRVALTARRPRTLDKALARLTAMGVPRDRLECAALDVNDADRIAPVLDDLAARMNDFAILVNNAGLVVSPRPLAAGSTADLRASIETNLFGPLAIAMHLLPAMKAACWGRIVNIASTAGLHAHKGLMPYAVSKAALTSLTRSLAVDTAEHGITVNAIAPGAVATENYIAAKGAGGVATRSLPIPTGRLTRPEEVAQAAAFLASRQAAQITGQTLVLDGGEGAAGPYVTAILNARQILSEEGEEIG